MILMLNNRDSFVFNLARYFTVLGSDVKVVDSDRVSVADIAAMSPEALVISPGPCTPDEAGISVSAVQELGSQLPILGVCLGHQAIASVFGWRICRAENPAHGRSAVVRHSGQRLFAGLPEAFEVGLYHSLIAMPEDHRGQLIVDAVSPAGEVMALSHPAWPVFGVQFHPESILTQNGADLLKNFLRMACEWRTN